MLLSSKKIILEALCSFFFSFCFVLFWWKCTLLSQICLLLSNILLSLYIPIRLQVQVSSDNCASLFRWLSIPNHQWPPLLSHFWLVKNKMKRRNWFAWCSCNWEWWGDLLTNFTQSLSIAVLSFHPLKFYFLFFIFNFQDLKMGFKTSLRLLGRGKTNTP